MLFGVIALLIVGASWCLVGIVLGRAPKDGLDTGVIQLLGALVSIVVSIVLALTIVQYQAVGWKPILVSCSIYAAAGGFNYLGLQAMAKGMEKGPNGIVWGIMQSAMVFPFVVGIIFFGVTPTLPRILGISSLLCALIMFSLAKDNTRKDNGEWQRWAFLALGLIAIQQNLATAPSYYPELQKVSPILRTLASALGTVLLSGLFLQKKLFTRPAMLRNNLRSPRIWIYVLAMQFFGLIFSYTLCYPGLDAMARAGAGSVSYPLMVGSCIFSFTVYAMLALHEKVSWKQMLALLFCGLGLIGLCFPDHSQKKLEESSIDTQMTNQMHEDIENTETPVEVKPE